MSWGLCITQQWLSSGSARPASVGRSRTFSAVSVLCRALTSAVCHLTDTMAPCAVPAAILSLLALSAAAPSQQGDPASSGGSPVAQLRAVLTPVVEEAVSRSGTGWQLTHLSVQLERLQLRLDSALHDIAELKLAALAGRGSSSICPSGAARSVSDPPPETPDRPGEEPRPESESETVCEPSPTPLQVAAAPHQEPAVRACARSCLQLRNRTHPPQDGVYWFTGMPVPVLCDFSHDGGGWTLLLTAVSHPGWDPLSALSRSPLSPSLGNDYSILEHADAIRDLGTGSRFAYRIETQAEKGRRRWGGIWLAPRLYSFIDETGTQTEVSRVRFFNNWSYKNHGIKKRMPWINTGLHGTAPVLTTTDSGRRQLVGHAGGARDRH